MITAHVISINSLGWPIWESCMAQWVDRTSRWRPFPGFWSLVRTIHSPWQRVETPYCSLMNHHLRLLGHIIKVRLFRTSTTIIFLTDTNSQKDHLEGTLYCIKKSCLSIILKWIKVWYWNCCVKSVMATVGFHWCSWLVLMTNIRWSQYISYIESSWLANLKFNGVSRMLKIMQWGSSNHTSVANLRCTGNLRPRMHFKNKGLKQA